MIKTENTEIDLDKLQAYLDAEREKAGRAKRAEIRAQIDKLLEEREERMAAERKADQERRDAGDPNLQAAKMIYAALGDQWGAFVSLMPRLSAVKMVTALSRLERERRTGTEHAATQAAPQIRADTKAVAETRIATEIEARLIAAGLMRDVTPENDV